MAPGHTALTRISVARQFQGGHPGQADDRVLGGRVRAEHAMPVSPVYEAVLTMVPPPAAVSAGREA